MFGLRQKAARERLLKSGIHLSPMQWQIYDAVSKMGRPVNARMIAEFLGYDSASITPRLPKLVEKSVLDVVYVVRGMDGHDRQYYMVGINGR